MGFYDWMLALHLLAAFSVAAALVLFSALALTSGRVTTLDEARRRFRVGVVGGPLIGAGMGLALLAGVVLAVASDDFEPWSGWVVAGLVLWALLAAVGARTGKYYEEAQKLARRDDAEAEVLARLEAPQGRVLTIANVALFVLIVLDMVFKPGA